MPGATTTTTATNAAGSDDEQTPVITTQLIPYLLITCQSIKLTWASLPM